MTKVHRIFCDKIILKMSLNLFELYLISIISIFNFCFNTELPLLEDSSIFTLIQLS